MPDQIFPEPTVGAFIFNAEGKLLLLESHKWPGRYVVPGGHVELGERLEEAEGYVWVEPRQALTMELDTYTRRSAEEWLRREGASHQT
jgi:hypothetical protein